MVLYDNMRSMVGAVIDLQPLPEQRELAKDEVIGGWTVPYPMRADWTTIFRVFGLWQSSNGICEDGMDIHVHSGAVREFWLPRPALVGDYILERGRRRQVVGANNRFDGSRGMWRAWIEYGVPPKPRDIDEQTFAYIEELHNTLETISSEAKALMDGFFSEVLPLCMAGPYPITTAPAQGAWQAKLQAYQQAIDDAKSELEAKKWRM